MAEESGMAVDETESLEFERDRDLNTWQRINLVMAEVGGHIEKDGQVKMRGGGGYEYITHDAVTAHVRGAMTRHGIAVRPSVINTEIDGNRTALTVQVDFINIDAPAQDAVSMQTVGFGVDPSDKGPGKAISYAVKYAYLKLFMLNSADDIEADDVEHEGDGSTQKLAQAQAKINDLDATAVNNLNAALKGARSVEQIDGLMESPENKKLLRGLPDVTREHFTNLAETLKRQMEEE